MARKTEELVDDLAGRVQGGKTRIEGRIKLTILAPFASLLMEAITEFRAKNPDCIVEIDASEDLGRLEYGEAHIALRAGARPDHPDYVVNNFGPVGFNLYAHDTYVLRHGLPDDTGDFTGHRFVLPQGPEGRLPFGQWLKDHVREDMIAVSSRDIWVWAEAISAGIGMGFMGDHEARQRGGLHPVLPPNPDWSVPAWLVTHVDLHRTEKVQAMLRCIRSTPQSLGDR